MNGMGRGFVATKPEGLNVNSPECSSVCRKRFCRD